MTAPKTTANLLADAEEIIRKKNAEIAGLNKDIRLIRKDNDTAETIRKAIYELSAHPPAPPSWLQKPGEPGSRGIPCTLWCDWHGGEVVEPSEVNGLNKFNFDVLKVRAKKLVDQTIDLSFNHMGRAKTKYPGAVVMLGGDMMTGEIHDELRTTNDRTSHQQVNDLTDILAGALDNMATAFGTIFVPEVVGNHGRGTLKPRMKNRVYTSFEWNIYCNLERHFRDTKNIHFHCATGADVQFRIAGHRYLLTHGDSLGVRGGDGIIGALGPIMRGSIKVGRAEAQVGRNIDTIVMGHWHQYLPLPGVIVGNCLIGYNEYARLGLRAPYSRPSQALWFTHPEHGITARWEVYLEKQPTVSTKWVELPKGLMQ